MKARPTTDFARESLFNILSNIIDFEGKRVLELFAGTGLFSFECLSRGADAAVAVDIDLKAVRFIRNTAEDLKFKNLSVIQSDAIRYCVRASTFDMVFADPPYGHKDTIKIVESVLDRKIVTPEGYLIMEHAAGTDFSALSNFVEKRTYGRVNFSIFKA
jgi:16S rRNA (guanine(966)-N(2))-methyltransferase RsmD